MAGDVNGDGYADFLVGLPGADTVRARATKSVLGGASAGATAALTLTSGVTGDEFGAALAGLGDINGDGYADFAIGAPGVNGDTDRCVSIWAGFRQAQPPL